MKSEIEENSAIVKYSSLGKKGSVSGQVRKGYV